MATQAQVSYSDAQQISDQNRVLRRFRAAMQSQIPSLCDLIVKETRKVAAPSSRTFDH